MTLYRNLDTIPVNDDIISTLKRVELNVTELCNRTCVFCPRHDPQVYKNRKLHMSLAVVRKIAQDLLDIDYHGTVGLTGFGEPFLYEHLVESISILARTSATVDINTNGDFITSHSVKNLEDAGLNTLYISMYDDDKTEYYQDLLRDINLNIIYRHHYDHSTNYNLNIVNRSYILKESTPLDILRPCHIPFYKMIIDYNGNYLLCSEDWGRSSSKDNVLNISIKDHWLHGYTKHRQALVQGRRELVEPCNKCNVDGTLVGQDSFDLWKNQ